MSARTQGYKKKQHKKQENECKWIMTDLLVETRSGCRIGWIVTDLSAENKLQEQEGWKKNSLLPIFIARVIEMKAPITDASNFRTVVGVIDFANPF
jgi:hypothetical protein